MMRCYTTSYPNLPLSESITLHNFYQPPVENPEAFTQEIASYANAMDFASVSFYPFFKAQNTTTSFQQAFDFLHQQIEKPIAFSETGHLSEDLQVPDLSLFLTGNQTEQRDYLITLLKNAQEEDYAYIIWWTHRDYNELWDTFPEEAKNLGSLWLSTGLINEDGMEKLAYQTWKSAYEDK